MQGTRVTVATGRAFGAAKKHLVYLGIDEPIITNGGALIARIGEPPIYEKTIDRHVAQNIALEFQSTGIPVLFSGPKRHVYPREGAGNREVFQAFGVRHQHS